MSKKTKERSDTKFSLFLKELKRKIIVALKRRPQIIPGLMLALSFIFYSFNLTTISNTTAKIQGSGMGLCGFCTMLFSILSFVCFLNGFPYRKKPNIPMISLMYVMFAIITYCDIHYIGRVSAALNRPTNPIKITASTQYIPQSQTILIVHIVLLAITAILVLLIPVFRKMLKKIDTSVEVAENESMHEIELAETD